MRSSAEQPQKNSPKKQIKKIRKYKIQKMSRHIKHLLIFI